MGCSPSNSASDDSKKSIISIKRQISNLQSLQIDPGIFVGKRKGNIEKYYKIEEKLGQGGYGFVRAGISKETGKKVAIKV